MLLLAKSIVLREQQSFGDTDLRDVCLPVNIMERDGAKILHFFFFFKTLSRKHEPLTHNTPQTSL